MCPGFSDAGFKEFSQTDGTAKMAMMGQSEEIKYRSKNFINADGTIGYAEIMVDDVIDYMFLSKTAEGDVLTISGEEEGDMPSPVEGYLAFTVAPRESTCDNIYDEHMKALEGHKAIADEAWLKDETPRLPQRAMDIITKAMETMLSAMGDIMGTMAQAMGDAFEEGFKGMGEAMGGEVQEGEGPKEEENGKKCPSCGSVSPSSETECSSCGEKLD